MGLAILSPDNFPLLDKMRKDLIEVGYKDDKGWNDMKLQGHAAYPIKMMMVVDGILCLFSHTHTFECAPVTLTASNYNEILTRCIAAINTTK